MHMLFMYLSGKAPSCGIIGLLICVGRCIEKCEQWFMRTLHSTRLISFIMSISLISEEFHASPDKTRAQISPLFPRFSQPRPVRRDRQMDVDVTAFDGDSCLSVGISSFTTSYNTYEHNEEQMMFRSTPTPRIMICAYFTWDKTIFALPCGTSIYGWASQENNCYGGTPHCRSLSLPPESREWKSLNMT